jgi:DTW domain-containing protein YfiP
MPPKGLQQQEQQQQLRQQQQRSGARAEARKLASELRAAGHSQTEIFEALTGASLKRREADSAQKCPRCWHEREGRCICDHLPPVPLTCVNVRVLVWMHHREYLNAGDDSKLLLAALPPERVELYIFGRPGDNAALAAELAVDPAHTLVLWPDDDAATVEEFLSALPEDSGWRNSSIDTVEGAAAVGGGNGEGAKTEEAGMGAGDVQPSLLRVVAIDGVYANARTMFKHLAGHLDPDRRVKHVALHPTTLSVYSRAQNGYAQASAVDCADTGLRICTVEAVALLLEELGEPPEITEALVSAVVWNNHALCGRLPWSVRGRQRNIRSIIHDLIEDVLAAVS